MKKLVLSLVMGAMMLSSVVTASAKTVDTKNATNGSTSVSIQSTDDSRGW